MSGVVITADTITPAQLRELLTDDDAGTRVAATVALGSAIPAVSVAAREACAALLNEREDRHLRTASAVDEVFADARTAIEQRARRSS